MKLAEQKAEAAAQLAVMASAQTEKVVEAQLEEEGVGYPGKVGAAEAAAQAADWEARPPN